MNEEDLNEQLNRDFNEEMDKEESEQMNNRSGNLNNNINNKPVASSKYTLEEINASLLEELEEKENEIEQLKLQLSSGGGMMSNESEKIVQLAKKNRNLTMVLNKEKARTIKLEQELASTIVKLKEATAASSSPTGTGPKNQNLANNTDQQLKQMKQKSDKLLQKNAELQQQLTVIKNEHLKMKGILQKEIIGSDNPTPKQLEDFEANLDKLINGDQDSDKVSLWRGRAQQILILKSKLNELKRKYDTQSAMSTTSSNLDSARSVNTSISSVSTGTTSTSGRNSPSASSDIEERNRKVVEKLEQKGKSELIEVKKELAEKNDSLAELKRKVDAMGARNKILEKSNNEMKSKIGRLIEKTQTDDKLIDALKLELEKRPKSRPSASSNGKLQDTVEQLQKVLNEKEAYIKSLKSEIVASQTRATSAYQYRKTDSNDPTDLKLSIAEIEVEKLKGRNELLVKQLNDNDKKGLEIKALLVKEKLRTVELEKKLAKATSSNTVDLSAEEATVVKEQILVMKEENMMLRSTLESTKKYCEDELDVYENLLKKQKQTMLSYISHLKQKMKETMSSDEIPTLEQFQNLSARPSSGSSTYTSSSHGSVGTSNGSINSSTNDNLNSSNVSNSTSNTYSSSNSSSSVKYSNTSSPTSTKSKPEPYCDNGDDEEEFEEMESKLFGNLTGRAPSSSSSSSGRRPNRSGSSKPNS